MNINCSKCLVVRRQRSGLYNFPAILKTLSTAAEDAGTDKTSIASLERLGKLFCSVFQNFKGSVSSGKAGCLIYFSNSNHLTSQLLVP